MRRIWPIVGLCWMSGSTQRRAIKSIRLSCFEDGFSSNLESTVSNACWFPMIDFTHSVKSVCIFHSRTSINLHFLAHISYIKSSLYHLIIWQQETIQSVCQPRFWFCFNHKRMYQSILGIDCSPQELFLLSSPWEVYQSYKHHSSLWMD